MKGMISFINLMSCIIFYLHSFESNIRFSNQICQYSEALKGGATTIQELELVRKFKAPNLITDKKIHSGGFRTSIVHPNLFYFTQLHESSLYFVRSVTSASSNPNQQTQALNLPLIYSLKHLK